MLSPCIGFFSDEAALRILDKRKHPTLEKNKELIQP